MPPAKRQQSDAMLYTLILFVFLFIVSTTIAVIYYVKFEDQRTIAEKAQSDLADVATASELQRIGTIVGAKQPRKSRLATMVDYLDRAVYLILGGLPEETSAEVKVGTAVRSFTDALTLAEAHIDPNTIDPNTTGLTRIVEKLKIKADDTTAELISTQEQLDDLQLRFDDAKLETARKEDMWLAEKAGYRQEIDDAKQDYNDLEVLLEQTSEERAQALITQVREAKADYEQEHQEKLKLQAQLKMRTDEMNQCKDELGKIVPLPDSEVVAHKEDGKIILVDSPAKVVHLNIGRADRVYPGLTFAVYDKNMPIPRDGKGKAEIEVFSVDKNISAARIVKSEIKRPIIEDDIVANLIWDSDRINVFAIEGEFDIDNDGNPDKDAVKKIKGLVEKWGGRVANSISIETDYLVLGSPLGVLSRPTLRELEMDPLAMERYEASLQNRGQYEEVQGQAQALSIPVFNYERFLFFIGYKTQSGRAGAF